MDPILLALHSKNKSSGINLKPCVFLDRDGTVNEEAGYINHPSRLKLLPGVGAAIRQLNEAGVLVVLVTNQAGVARGYFSLEVLMETLDRMTQQLAVGGARLDGLYFAPYHPGSKDPRWVHDPDNLRKPGLGMIAKALKKHPIDLDRSYMVGDRQNDIIFAHKAGLKGVYVKTGYGLGEYTYQRDQWTDQPEHIAQDLTEAVKWILQDLQQK